jgi:hypothetical protein
MTTTEKKTMNVGKYVVRVNGVVSREETLNTWAEALDAFIAADVPVDMTPVAAAIEAVFAAVSGPPTAGKTLATGDLLARAVLVLAPPANEAAKAMENIKSFIKSESARFEASSGNEGLLVSSRGANGGVSLRSDVVVARWREMMAKKASKNAPTIVL